MLPTVPSAKLVTLGQLALQGGEGQSLVPNGSTKLLGLLAFLAAAPGRRATREHLIDLFWDDTNLKHARGSLRQSLHRLRMVLGEEYFPGGDDDVMLSDRLTCDRDEFLAALAAGNLDQAIAGYGGEYIPGFVSRGSAGFEHWRDQERERLRSLFAATAESVALRALADGIPQRAATLAARLLVDEPLLERAWRLRLRAEQQIGSQVHLTASIAELRRAFATAGCDPEPRTLKLLDSLERPVDSRSEPADPPTLMTDMVGRGPVLALLYDAWRDAARRRGIHLHLTGRAGLGKTRVLEDFAVRLRAERGRVVHVRAMPRQRMVPGAMLSSVVGALVDLPGATGMSAQSARILLPLHPAVAARFPTAVPLEFADPDARFLAMLGSLDDLTDAVSHEAPCCLLLDDAHWWDDQSRHLIEQLLERLDTRPVLVVTASRPGHGTVATGRTRETVALTPLTRDDVLALLQSVGEHGDGVALARLADGLQRAADGVPLMVLEAVRLGLDRSLLGLHDRQWNLDRQDDFLSGLHPGRLLDERLALLAEGQRELLLVAWLLELPLTAGDLPTLGREADLGALTELDRLGFLQATHDGWVVAHDAIGEAIEASAPADAQRRAHHFAGQLVRRRGESPKLLAQAAAHFADAGTVDELLVVATTWLRQRRRDGSDASSVTLIQALLGVSASPVLVRGVVASLPRELRRRPWTGKRLWPWGVAAMVTVLVSGWIAVDHEPQPDAVLSLLTRDASGQLAESRVALFQRTWPEDGSALVAMRVRRTAWATELIDNRDELVKDPQNDRWASSRALPEGSADGPTELVLQDAQGTITLAPAGGDDVQPSWSPDGKYLAYATTRWSDSSDTNFDIALLRVADGAVRPLTTGPDAEEAIHWSPDGTRISYVKRSLALVPDSLCWKSFDGATGRCRGFGQATLVAIPGWIDGERQLVTVQDGDRMRVLAVHLDGGLDRELDITPVSVMRLAPDGMWLLLEEVQAQGRKTGTSMRLLRLADPSRVRSVVVPKGSMPPRIFWRDIAPRPSVALITLMHHGDTLTTRIPTKLMLEGSDATGQEIAIPPSVVRWSSSDSAVATVDSLGTVTAHRAGMVTVTASAGGWRTVSKTFTAMDGVRRIVWEEQWQSPWQARWTSWGTPEPMLVAHRDDSSMMLPNGDGQYSSGLFSRQTFDARAGLALDVVLQTPITRPKWQFIDVAIRLPGAMAASGPTGEGCGLRYPAGEGGMNQRLMQGLPVDSLVYSGRPYRVRLQLFPDGSCGIALNGLPFNHAPQSRVRPADMHIALGGQTVASQLLIGRVTVWTGVPTDVDWRGVR